MLSGAGCSQHPAFTSQLHGWRKLPLVVRIRLVAVSLLSILATDLTDWTAVGFRGISNSYPALLSRDRAYARIKEKYHVFRFEETRRGTRKGSR